MTVVKQSVYNHSTGGFESIPDDDPTPINKSKPATTTTTWVKTCDHKGTLPLFVEVDAEGNRREYVIADSTNANTCEADVALDLNNNIKSNIITKAPEKYMALNEVSAKMEVVKFDWPDYQAIKAPMKFWLKLFDVMPKNGRVMISCHGGHGRSGTCLAAILVARGMTSGQAMEYVRTVHCHKAVESDKQEKYLITLAIERELLGVDRSMVSDALLEVTREDGQFYFCTWCGRTFKDAPAPQDTCQDCYKDGYRANGTLHYANGQPKFFLPKPSTSVYGYNYNYGAL